jgi:hypothetical protein
VQDGNEEIDMGLLDEMKCGLMRRNERFQELNEEYEVTAESRQLGGYDESDDELKENVYPPRLIENLREAYEDLNKENPEVGLKPHEFQTNDEIVKMWIMYDLQISSSCDGECICGQTGLRFLYFMRINNVNNWQLNTRIVGSECIKWFCKVRPTSSLIFIQRVVKDGCTIVYRKKLSNNLIEGTLCGNQLPEFLVENRIQHAGEHVMPLRFRNHEQDEGQRTVEIRMRILGKQMLDSRNKPLTKGKKYRVHLKPVLKPNKDPNKISILDFVVLQMVRDDEKRTETNREPTAKDFLK